MTAARQLTGRQGVDRVTDPLAAAIDYRLLAAVGRDPATQTLAPDRDHPLLGYRVCRVAGCEPEAPDPSGLCTGCRDRFHPGAGSRYRDLLPVRPGPHEPLP